MSFRLVEHISDISDSLDVHISLPLPFGILSNQQDDSIFAQSTNEQSSYMPPKFYILGQSDYQFSMPATSPSSTSLTENAPQPEH